MNTGNYIDPAIEEEFEDLMAASLCDELDQAGEDRLQLLVDEHAELGDRYQQYHGMQNFLQKSGVATFTDLQATSPISQAPLSTKDLVRPANRVRTGFFAVAGSLAAALAIAVTAFFITNQDQSSSSKMLTFPHRTCKTAGQSLTNAGEIPSDDLQSGAGSFCDGEINSEGNQVAFRLFPNSGVRIEESSEGLHMHLDKGRILINARRSPGKKIQVHTPGHQVTILGTELVITRENQTDINVELVKGQAEVRSAPYMHLKKIRKGLPHKTERLLARDNPELFDSKVFVLESGNSVRVRRPAGLTPRQKALLDKLDKSLQKAESAATDDDQILDIQKQIKIALKENPEVPKAFGKNETRARHQKIEGQRKWLLQRWSQNINFLDDSRSLEDSYEQKQREIKPEQILEELNQEAPPALLYRIRLKDGRAMTGMVIQQGNNYRLMTDLGDIIIPRDDVEALDLFYE